jgi:hypothetical protein
MDVQAIDKQKEPVIMQLAKQLSDLCTATTRFAASGTVQPLHCNDLHVEQPVVGVVLADPSVEETRRRCRPLLEQADSLWCTSVTLTALVETEPVTERPSHPVTRGPPDARRKPPTGRASWWESDRDGKEEQADGRWCKAATRRTCDRMPPGLLLVSSSLTSVPRTNEMRTRLFR